MIIIFIVLLCVFFFIMMFHIRTVMAGAFVEYDNAIEVTFAEKDRKIEELEYQLSDIKARVESLEKTKTL